MSGLMAKLFGNEPQQQPAQSTPPQPGNLPANAGATDSQNPQVPPGTVDNSQQQQQQSDSPLADFATLWEPVTGDDGKPVNDQPAIPQLKAEDVQKIVAKADFSQAVTPDVIQAITEGGEGAQQALITALNAAVSQGVTQAIMVGNKLTETAVNQAIQASESKIPQLLRNQATSDHMKNSNPIFKNPAVQPVIEATKAQLLQKFPNATAQEITEMTQNFIVAMGNEFGPKQQVNDNSETGEVDWDKYISS